MQNYEEIMQLFQERGISTSVNRWKFPVYGVGALFSFNNFRPLGICILLYILARGFFSKNRNLSRRSETLCLFTGLTLAAMTIAQAFLKK